MNQILSDEEVDKLHGFAADTSGRLVFRKAIRDAEAAILAKLAGMELPKPIQRDDTEHGVDYYTADQLRQAYAQGAAAQLSAEPAGYLYDMGDDASWASVGCDKPEDGGITLYTRKEAK